MKFFLSLALLVISQRAFSYGIGISSHPIPEKKGVFTTELTSFVSEERAMGMQARYVRKLNNMLQVEGGIGFSDGDRGNRIFVSSDLEFYPDYGKQPRVAVKGFIENASEFKNRRTILGIAPLVSKIIPVGSSTVNPFLALPVGLTLERTTKKYEMRTMVAVGVTGPLPFGEMSNLIYNFEGNLNVQNSFTALYFGVSYPL